MLVYLNFKHNWLSCHLTGNPTLSDLCIFVCIIVKGDGGLVIKSCLTLATPWTIACQTPLSRQAYWRELPFPSPDDLPDSGIEPTYPALQVDSLPTEPPGKPIYC